MRLILIFITIFSSYSYAQNNYPQDYFGNPLEIPLLLSGTFAELRSNHFHAGMDIKTQQRIGLNVISIADGFVSRIKVSHYGYGKAIYITHPNGYTSVYGHLQKFSPDIEAYVKKHQYENESFEIELFPKASELMVSKGELVAYSGNTGGSGGPHLHFEIRDKNEHPINPMLFGLDIKDTTMPSVTSIYAYPIGENASVNKSTEKQKLRLTPLKNGDYVAENIEAYGKIGFGVSVTDRQDLSHNKNGVYNIQTFINGRQNFEIDFSTFSFDESRHINQLIDYEHFQTKKQRVQLLFNNNNPLSLYKNMIDNGVITMKDSTYAVYKIKVNDFKNNPAWITISIKGKKSDGIKLKKDNTTALYLYANESKQLKDGNITVDFFRDTFYNNLYLDYNVSGDTLTIHKDIVPLKKDFKITFDISKFSDADKDKLYIARLIGYKNYPGYNFTERTENTLSTRTKTLGTYTLAFDTTKPTITPINFKNEQWLSNYRYLKIKIDDDRSGISNYRATINGKWVLMEYDYKTNTLTHDFNDGCVTETKNILKVIVTDNVGNNSTFESLFYRK
ncbi:peptidase M23 [Pseudalgibacter alginicilyticus]|uniref:Peptidase M23 n=2 Tax=Pseudalgibacter alginicilyticus TaxID=1736674 RepID=A0A0N7HZ05_9FLAO|nr:M23 family metallopeptidase [Pseudalgibacter alginicilyticus]ALJ06710.1 peptidase M23 [Pseudalgibacter alginicilyticus]